MAAVDETIEVREADALDGSRLESHLRANLDLPPDALVVRQFPGGRANLTYRLDFGPTRLVLRRPPRGTLAPGAHDMAREYRVLSRLGAVYARAPRALHYCADESIVGAPFVIVEHRSGVVVRAVIPPELVHHRDVERRTNLALVRAAAELHAIDVASVGLEDLGNPEGFGDRQVSGWRRRWERARPDGASGLMDEVAAALAESVPKPARVSIVHNDLKLDNCQFQPDDPDVVTSIFDWDMATLGDPLFDLGVMVVAMRTDAAWVLRDEEAIAAYGAASGMDRRSFGWYVAFATWRTAVVVQQLVNRWDRGDSSDDRMAGVAEHVSRYAEEASRLLAGSEPMGPRA